jgi:calcium-binding protein CML
VSPVVSIASAADVRVLNASRSCHIKLFNMLRLGQVVLDVPDRPLVTLEGLRRLVGEATKWLSSDVIHGLLTLAVRDIAGVRLFDSLLLDYCQPAQLSKYDRNKNGKLDGKDVPLLLDKLGIDRSKLTPFMQKFDANKDGTIEYEEFKAVVGDSVRKQVAADHEAKLRAAFDSFDKDKNGVLTLREITALMDYLKLDEATAARAMERADKDNDSKLSFDEFCIIVRPKKK